MATDGGWIIGRIQINGPDDIAAVAAFQQRLSAVPLSGYGKPYAPPENTDLHTDWPKDQEVAAYIHHLTPRQYWDLYYCSLSHNQSRPEDKDLLAQLSTAGWAADKKLDLGALSESDRSMWQNGWTKALSKIEVDLGVQQVNGWQISRTDIGSYGSNYSARATVAHGGLGANLPEDAIYPATRVDANNGPLPSDRAYVLHLGKEQIPPVHAFWSLTKYNEKGFFVANPINRYAVRASVAEEPRRLGRHLHPAPKPWSNTRSQLAARAGRGRFPT